MSPRQAECESVSKDGRKHTHQGKHRAHGVFQRGFLGDLGVLRDEILAQTHEFRHSAEWHRDATSSRRSISGFWRCACAPLTCCHRVDGRLSDRLDLLLFNGRDLMLFEYEKRRQDELGQTIAGPRCSRRHDQPAEQDQRPVIVDPPACKIAPGFLPVRFEG